MGFYQFFKRLNYLTSFFLMIALFQNCVGNAEFTSSPSEQFEGLRYGEVGEFEIIDDSFDGGSYEEIPGLTLPPAIDITGIPIGGATGRTNLPGSTPIDISIVRNSCKSKQPVFANYKIKFPKPVGTCSWNTNGNGEMKNNHFMARRVEAVELPIPEEAIICDMGFIFKEQNFWYDDIFALMLDKNILASGYDLGVYLPEQNNLFQYDWNDLYGEFRDDSGHRKDYCAGKNSTCSYPSQHKEGLVKLHLSSNVIQSAMANSGLSQHSFNLLTTGDDNPGVRAGELDCSHYDIEFLVTVSYVQ